MESILTDIVYNRFIVCIYSYIGRYSSGFVCFLFVVVLCCLLFVVVVFGCSLDLVVFSSVQPKIESEPEKSFLELKKVGKKCLNNELGC